jgi:hypothetical protein
MTAYAKTTGSKGIHVYVPIVRGPTQKQVWTFAKELARTLEKHAPELVTAEYRVAKRPAGRVLVDYNQNAWGRRWRPCTRCGRARRHGVRAGDWDELEAGAQLEDFTLFNVPGRVKQHGDLWRGLLDPANQFDLGSALCSPSHASDGAHAADTYLNPEKCMDLPIPITYAPMEAATLEEVPEGDVWSYEPKWDGFRCLAFRDGDEISSSRRRASRWAATSRTL